MAGGRGQRLRPLTDDCPKPMLRIGGRPILQIIVESLVRQGFNDFYISVNYKRDMVRQHFGDGSAWGARIRYVEEEESSPLGTAGALSLLPEKPKHSMIVMNGDILTKVAFGSLLDFHHRARQRRDHVRARLFSAGSLWRGRTRRPPPLRNRREAGASLPGQRRHLRAGTCRHRARAAGATYDMPALFERLTRERRLPACFRSREYWLDIGRIDDFNKANDDYVREFWTARGAPS